jgi:hypothetical protein
MVRGNRYPPASWRWPLVPAACFLLLLVVGCGKSASPEHAAAMSKLQQLGARVNFKNGGYEVDLRQTAIADGDLVHLQKIDNLRTVQLANTRISDDGLEHLKPIKTLVHVDLTGAAVTRDGLAELRKSLPEAAIVP